ncbi:uncharacterized protein Bfra_012435 [Botrytis fragariae]|uniref:Uncharacterized protein n=1 Tax=Botrytis fragariae TaxID=1964551 RepID=A0A8H6AIS7_9HELO|nr:uncharacterized protein Bfra_012435 [Botrytis fragariae]KAF5868523.1 hypothetical protein Bfra_012435 [Botrytis fragariae]
MRGYDDEGSREWSWGEEKREREKEKEKYSNPKRRITSTARITRKGTFGERFREKSAVLQDEEKVSLEGQSFTSHDFDRSGSDGRGRTERARYIDTGTSICDRISGEEYSSEDGMSVGEDLPAVVGAGVVAARKRGGVCEMLEAKGRCDDGAREEGGDIKSRGMGMGVRGKKLRREENDCEFEICKERERGEVSFGSRVSSFVGAVDDKDIEEEGDLQHKDTDFDFEVPEREELTHSQTTIKTATSSRIPIEYLKSRRSIPRKTVSRENNSDYFQDIKSTRRWK